VEASDSDEEETMSAIPVVELMEEHPLEVNDHSVLGLTELLLKNPGQVDTLVREENRQSDLIPRFLAIALGSFSIYALAMVLLLGMAPSESLPEFLKGSWTQDASRAGISLWLAYTLGLVAATGICLPSFYFYGLLSGVKVTALQVTTHTMKGMSATSLMLLGLLPIYVTWALGLLVFGPAPEIVKMALKVGLILPFIAGLWGIRSFYLGFMQLADTLPPERRCRRECFLRRLTLACAACYTAVTPVMIYTLWDNFANKLG
jgi:hypothetical protein